jgi:hypothetical protein
MGEQIRNHIRSNVVGYVAVFIALSGTAYAVDGPLPGQDTVGSADIIDNDVRTEDIRDGNVNTSDIDSEAVTTGKITNGEVRSADVADDSTGFALTGTDIANSTLGSDDLANGAVTGAKLGLFAVSSTRISPGAVSESKLNTNAVDPEALAAINERRVSDTVGPGLTELTSPCNSDEQVISGGGGGGGLVFETDIDVIQSFRNGNGWTVRLINKANADRNVFVDAYCLDE